MMRRFFDPQLGEMTSGSQLSSGNAEKQSSQADGLAASPGPGHGAKASEEPNTGREMSFGEKAVGLSFNPGGNPAVNEIKQRFAHTIDYLNLQREVAKNGEVKRMLSIAITEAQTAQMWAVKAVTWNF